MSEHTHQNNLPCLFDRHTQEPIAFGTVEKIVAHQEEVIAALLAALEGLFEHCAMIHKSWGEGDNTREANAAQSAALAAIAAAKGRKGER